MVFRRLWWGSMEFLSVKGAPSRWWGLAARSGGNDPGSRVPGLVPRGRIYNRPSLAARLSRSLRHCHLSFHYKAFKLFSDINPIEKSQLTRSSQLNLSLPFTSHVLLGDTFGGVHSLC
jgi:hypothetical protein